MRTKEFITRYLDALSGKPKPLPLIRTWVANDALIKHILEVEAAFPRYVVQAEDMVAEDDKVAVRAVFRGVHEGEFAGIPGTGKAVSTHLIAIYRIAEERIVEFDIQFDLAGLMQQLESPTLSVSAGREVSA